MIPLNERHLRRVLAEWSPHYIRERPHSSLGPGLPDERTRRTSVTGQHLPWAYRVVDSARLVWATRRLPLGTHGCEFLRGTPTVGQHVECWHSIGGVSGTTCPQCAGMPSGRRTAKLVSRPWPFASSRMSSACRSRCGLLGPRSPRGPSTSSHTRGIGSKQSLERTTGRPDLRRHGDCCTPGTQFVHRPSRPLGVYGEPPSYADAAGLSRVIGRSLDVQRGRGEILGSQSGPTRCSSTTPALAVTPGRSTSPARARSTFPWRHSPSPRERASARARRSDMSSALPARRNAVRLRDAGNRRPTTRCPTFFPAPCANRCAAVDRKRWRSDVVVLCPGSLSRVSTE